MYEYRIECLCVWNFNGRFEILFGDVSIEKNTTEYIWTVSCIQHEVWSQQKIIGCPLWKGQRDNNLFHGHRPLIVLVTDTNMEVRQMRENYKDVRRKREINRERERERERERAIVWDNERDTEREIEIDRQRKRTRERKGCNKWNKQNDCN